MAVYSFKEETADIALWKDDGSACTHQVSAVPFVAGALYLDPPYAYLSLLPGYIIGG